MSRTYPTFAAAMDAERRSAVHGIHRWVVDPDAVPSANCTGSTLVDIAECPLCGTVERLDVVTLDTSASERGEERGVESLPAGPCTGRRES